MSATGTRATGIFNLRSLRSVQLRSPVKAQSFDRVFARAPRRTSLPKLGRIPLTAGLDFMRVLSRALLGGASPFWARLTPILPPRANNGSVSKVSAEVGPIGIGVPPTPA